MKSIPQDILKAQGYHILSTTESVNARGNLVGARDKQHQLQYRDMICDWAGGKGYFCFPSSPKTRLAGETRLVNLTKEVAGSG